MKNPRWFCERCNQKWIYPIETCIRCKKATAKQVGTMFTIIACTKVELATPSHPVVPYHIALLRDEHNNIFPQIINKEVKLGDHWSQEKTNDKDAVAFVYVPHDEELAFEDAKDLLGTKTVHSKKITLGNLAFNEVILVSQNKKSIDDWEAFLTKKSNQKPTTKTVGMDPELMRS